MNVYRCPDFTRPDRVEVAVIPDGAIIMDVGSCCGPRGEELPPIVWIDFDKRWFQRDGKGPERFPFQPLPEPPYYEARAWIYPEDVEWTPLPASWWRWLRALPFRARYWLRGGRL